MPNKKIHGESLLSFLSDPGAIQIEAVADTESSADGKPKLPRFQMVAYTGGPMRIAGWRCPVIVDLAGLSVPSQSRPIRFGHDMASGVGHSDAIRVEDGKLVATGVVSRDTSAAKEIVISARNGFPWQASIGAAVEEFEFIKENQKVLVNGREFLGPVNVVRRSTLGEISFVDLGADGQTSASVAAAAFSVNHFSEEKTNMDEHVNTNPDTVTAQATEVPTAPTTVTATAEPAHTGQSVAEVRAAAVAETNRVAAIREICGSRFPKIEAQAIGEGWDATRTELEVMRASRPKAPAMQVRDGNGTVSGSLLEAACVLTAKLEGIDKHYDEPTLEAAQQRFRGGIGLQELLLEAAWANGYTGRNFRDSRAVLRFAFKPELEAGFSTIDIGGILSNVANKFLLDGFFSVERTWRNICAVRNVSDFKTVTSYRLIGADQYEQVAPGGELKHGTLGSESYTNKADTYGLMLSLDRRDIINDDLGAITTVPRKLGRGSGLKINDVFWNTFLANSSFFTSGNKNYLTGADTALGIDGLTKAEVSFMDLCDSDGKPIGIMPAICLVPTALSAMGTQLTLGSNGEKPFDCRQVLPNRGGKLHLHGCHPHGTCSAKAHLTSPFGGGFSKYDPLGSAPSGSSLAILTFLRAVFQSDRRFHVQTGTRRVILMLNGLPGRWPGRGPSALYRLAGGLSPETAPWGASMERTRLERFWRVWKGVKKKGRGGKHCCLQDRNPALPGRELVIPIHE